MNEPADGVPSGTPRPWHRVKTAPFLVLGVLAVDQLTKLAIRWSLAIGQTWPQGARLRLTNVVNPGILFGTPASSLVSLLLPAAMVLISLALYWRFKRTGSRVLTAGTGLFVGGTLGNLVDRVLYSHVTDFVEVVWDGGDSSMVFNLADLCILAGIVLLEVFVIREIVRVVMARGLRYNPFKPAFVRLMRSNKGPWRRR